MQQTNPKRREKSNRDSVIPRPAIGNPEKRSHSQANTCQYQGFHQCTILCFFIRHAPQIIPKITSTTENKWNENESVLAQEKENARLRWQVFGHNAIYR